MISYEDVNNVNTEGVQRETVANDVKRLETSAETLNRVRDIALIVPAVAAVVAAGTAKSQIFVAAAALGAVGVGVSTLLYNWSKKKVLGEIDTLVSKGEISEIEKTDLTRGVQRFSGALVDRKQLAVLDDQ